MKQADIIKHALMLWVKGGYDVVLPNFYLGAYECDLLRITQSDFLFEYEIKISRSDFFNDFKKGSKHIDISKRVNRFFFVVPENLVSVNEVPAYAGLIYFKDGRLNIIKNAKLLHKNKFNQYRNICHTLNNTVHSYRDKLKKYKIGVYDRQIANLQAEVNALKNQNREYSNELFMRKYSK